MGLAQFECVDLLWIVGRIYQAEFRVTVVSDLFRMIAYEKNID